MNGFFGLIWSDQGAWQGFDLVPHPDEAVAMIARFRTMVALAGVPEDMPVHDGVHGLTDTDFGAVGWLAAFAFTVDDPEKRMIAATSIAALLNWPYFWIDGRLLPGGRHDCKVVAIQAQSVDEAQIALFEHCAERFALPFMNRP